MGMQFGGANVVVNSGSVTATIAGNLPAPSASQSLINKCDFGTIGTATSRTIHTVTAGKTFYCLGISVGSGSTAGNYRIKSDGTVVDRGIIGTGFSPCSKSGGVLFTTAATKAITIDLESGGDTAATSTIIWGYEV